MALAIRLTALTGLALLTAAALGWLASLGIGTPMAWAGPMLSLALGDESVGSCAGEI